jgi:hypothetical protein
METTPSGTPVGVDDPYAVVDRCDHLTDDGRCRFAIEHADQAPAFARERRREDYACPVVAAVADTDDAPDWADCPQFRATASERVCRRCGLAARPLAHDDERPLLEEHHLSYPGEAVDHEITVMLCRWCHAKVHASQARVDEDATPDPAAEAAVRERREREQREAGFETAADRYTE